jgi:hypothetical protein
MTVFDRTRRTNPEPVALSAERKRLVFRYMTDAAVAEEPVEVPAVEAAQAAPPVERAANPRPARRGRPPGRKARRQVHFHVDPDEDRLLLSAVARFGSQQKGLIAALRALAEVEELRERVRALEAEHERPEG